MVYCATCIYWKQKADWYDLYSPSNLYDIEEERPERLAQIKTHNRESGECQKVLEGWADDDGVTPLPMATCWDGSQYRASLRTHKDFGCVLHEAVRGEER